MVMMMELSVLSIQARHDLTKKLEEVNAHMDQQVGGGAGEGR